MSMHSLRRAALGMALAALVPVPAAAQTVDRPFRGLFGTSKPSRQQATLTFSMFEEYGNNVTAGTGSDLDSPMTYRGAFTGMHADLAYTRRDPGLTFSMRGTGALRYYPDLRTFTPVRSRGEMALTALVGRRRHTTLDFAGSVEYTPYYRLLLLPDMPAVASADGIVGADSRDDALFRRQAYIYEAALREVQQISSRLSLVFNQDILYARFTAGGIGVEDVRAGGRFSYRINRDVSLRLGYQYRRGLYGQPVATERFQAHDIDVGVDYERALARRTTFEIRTGSSLVSSMNASNQQYRLVGSALLRHRMGRGWAAHVEYRRGVQLLEAAGQPLFSDTATAGLTGYIGRRVDILGSAGYSFGTIGSHGSPYQHLAGSFRIRTALGRYVALDGQYLYYRHDLGSTWFGPEVLPRMDRQAVRVNLTFWFPLFR